MCMIVVKDNNVDQSIRILKKKLQKEGLFKELKNRVEFEKPSKKRARERSEAIRRLKKLSRKSMNA